MKCRFSFVFKSLLVIALLYNYCLAYGQNGMHIDTSLSGFQIYNPVYNLSVFKHLGNTGSATQYIHYKKIIPAELDFDYGYHQYDIFEIKPNNVRYYQVKSPFTELYYVTGSKNENIFKVVHTQNFSKNVNMCLEHGRIFSEGFYLRQLTNNWNLAGSVWLKSKNEKYNLFTNVVLNRLKVQENGGMSNDSVFEHSQGVNKKTLSVNLAGAENRWKGQSFYIKQQLGFGTYPSSDSSAATDSSTTPEIIAAPKKRLEHLLLIERRSFVYEDEFPVSDFYPSKPFDTLQTIDSNSFSKIENVVSFIMLPEKLQGDVWVKHQYVLLTQNKSDSGFSNLFTGVDIKSSGYKMMSWHLQSQYGFMGYNKDDFSVKASVHKQLKKSILSFQFLFDKTAPAFIYQKYYSNHFEWQYEFEKTKIFTGAVAFINSKKKFKIDISLRNITNHIYFDFFARPKQFKEPVNIIVSEFLKEFKFKNFGAKSNVIYQYVAEHNVIRIPEWIVLQSLYYERITFKKSSMIKVGIDLFYNTGFFSDAYMPAIGQFYLQNEKKTGNYPYIDFFINFQVKRARLFFKTEHLNSGLSGNTYYMTPHYPMPDRAFKFGVSWMFYD